MSNGSAGHLVYGPYAALPAGAYVARLWGSFSCIEAGAILDVAVERGALVLAKLDISSLKISTASTGNQCIELPFILDKDCLDLEVRLYLAAAKDAEQQAENPVSLDRLEILPCKDLVPVDSQSILRTEIPAKARNSASRSKKRRTR
jgi:hypothetical protein